MKSIRYLIAFIIVSILLLSFWWNTSLAPVDKTNKKPQIFVVGKGQGLKETANKLKEEKLIRDSTVFYLLAKQMNIESKIQAGDFRLSQSMSANEIAQKLTKGTLENWVTIPEGKRSEEIAAILKENIPSYKDTWIDMLKTNEGYLFPDTYLFPKDATIDLIIKTMKNNFAQKYATITNSQSKSQREIVILASLVEREAKLPQDRPLVASVLYNRLRIGMPLQIDATVQYALGYQPQQQTWWKRSLSLNDLAISSAYNTYKNTGLPPTPIANPGLDALQAAANPAKTQYLYYISDKNGVNHYAETLDQHNANIKKYGL